MSDTPRPSALLNQQPCSTLRTPWGPSLGRIGDSVTLPTLDAEGLLPPGRHRTNRHGLYSRLVEPFRGLSTTREMLYDLWSQRRDGLGHLCPTEDWVDGSFVTGKVDPNDTDVLTHLVHEDLQRLDEDEKAQLAFLVGDNLGCKQLYRCDVYALVEVPEDHPHRPVYERMWQYWDNWWGHTRDDPPKPKGYVIINE